MPAIPTGDWKSGPCMTVGDLREKLARIDQNAEVKIADGLAGHMPQEAKLVTCENGSVYIWWDLPGDLERRRISPPRG